MFEKSKKTSRKMLTKKSIDDIIRESPQHVRVCSENEKDFEN